MREEAKVKAAVYLIESKYPHRLLFNLIKNCNLLIDESVNETGFQGNLISCSNLLHRKGDL